MAARNPRRRRSPEMVIGRHECRNALGTHLREAIAITLDEAMTAPEEALCDLTDERHPAMPAEDLVDGFVAVFTECCVECRLHLAGVSRWMCTCLGGVVKA